MGEGGRVPGVFFDFTVDTDGLDTLRQWESQFSSVGSAAEGAAGAVTTSFDGVGASVEGAGDAAEDASKQIEDASDATKQAGDSADATTSKMDALGQAGEELGGPFGRLVRTFQNAKKSLASVKAASASAGISLKTLAVVAVGAAAAVVGIVVAVKAARAAMAGLAKFTADSTIKAGAYRAEVANLAATLKGLGINTDETRNSMLDYADEIAIATNLTREQARAAQVLGLNMGASAEQVNDLALAAANMAAANPLIESADQAIRQIAKTLGGMSGEIGELIPEVVELTAEERKQGIVIDLINEKYAGLAVALGRTLPAAIQETQDSFDSLQEAIGGPFSEVLEILLNEGINPLIREFTTATEGADLFRVAVFRLGIAMAREAEKAVALGQGIALLGVLMRQAGANETLAALNSVRDRLQAIQIEMAAIAVLGPDFLASSLGEGDTPEPPAPTEAAPALGFGLDEIIKGPAELAKFSEAISRAAADVKELGLDQADVTIVGKQLIDTITDQIREYQDLGFETSAADEALQAFMETLQVYATDVGLLATQATASHFQTVMALREELTLLQEQGFEITDVMLDQADAIAETASQMELYAQGAELAVGVSHDLAAAFVQQALASEKSGKNAVKAGKLIISAVLKTVAQIATIKATESIATGLLALAQKDYAGAAAAFGAAVLWGTLAGAASGAAAAVASSESEPERPAVVTQQEQAGPRPVSGSTGAGSAIPEGSILVNQTGQEFQPAATASTIIIQAFDAQSVLDKIETDSDFREALGVAQAIEFQEA